MCGPAKSGWKVNIPALGSLLAILKQHFCSFDQTDHIHRTRRSELFLSTRLTFPPSPPTHTIVLISTSTFCQNESYVFWDRVFKNFGQKRDVYTKWTKLHEQKLYNFWSSPSILMIIKPRQLLWIELHGLQNPEVQCRIHKGSPINIEKKSQLSKFRILNALVLVPHCEDFSTSHPSWVQIFASGSWFQIILACVPTLM